MDRHKGGLATDAKAYAILNDFEQLISSAALDALKTMM